MIGSDASRHQLNTEREAEWWMYEYVFQILACLRFSAILPENGEESDQFGNVIDVDRINEVY